MSFFIPFPFPNFGNGIIHSRSRSRTPKCHSRSPLHSTICNRKMKICKTNPNSRIHHWHVTERPRQKLTSPTTPSGRFTNKYQVQQFLLAVLHWLKLHILSYNRNNLCIYQLQQQQLISQLQLVQQRLLMVRAIIFCPAFLLLGLIYLEKYFPCFSLIKINLFGTIFFSVFLD